MTKNTAINQLPSQSQPAVQPAPFISRYIRHRPRPHCLKPPLPPPTGCQGLSRVPRRWISRPDCQTRLRRRVDWLLSPSSPKPERTPGHMSCTIQAPPGVSPASLSHCRYTCHGGMAAMAGVCTSNLALFASSCFELLRVGFVWLCYESPLSPNQMPISPASSDAVRLALTTTPLRPASAASLLAASLPAAAQPNAPTRPPRRQPSSPVLFARILKQGRYDNYSNIIPKPVIPVP